MHYHSHQQFHSRLNHRSSRGFTTAAILVVVTLHGHRVSADLDLMIVHSNDMHARYEQTDVYGTQCTEDQAKTGQCYGGFPRLKNVVDQARQEAEHHHLPFLHLSAGDTFQGTLYYNMFRWKMAARLINQIGIDVMSLGNHEFDEGIGDLSKFLEEISMPVVCSNLNLTLEPKLDKSAKLSRSKIIKIRDKNIGIVGYLTPETSDLAATENVIFLNEVSALRAEVAKLKKDNVNIIIALGHSGFTRDIEIAEKVPDLSLIIGGHSHTFMYNSFEQPPSIEVPKANYPHMVTTKTGRKIPIVHAYCKTKYVGKFKVKFNDYGAVIGFSGRPILLNSSIDQDQKLLKEIMDSKKKMLHVSSRQLGKTRVFLSMEPIGDIFESNLANLILDSYVDYAAMKMPDDLSTWADASISLMQGGIIKSNFDHRKSQGIITYGDLLSILPFDNKLVKVQLTGAVIVEALEYSVRRLSYSDRLPFFQEFLQFSGLKVVYDLSKPAGERVKSVTVRCNNCSVPIYTDLESDQLYSVITTYYTTSGGDGYYMLKYKNKGIQFMGSTDIEVVADYIERQKIVHPSIEDRITVLFPPQPSVLSSANGLTIIFYRSQYWFTAIISYRLMYLAYYYQ